MTKAPVRTATASGRDIHEAPEAFVARWRLYDGSERAEAQTFLNELFACYGSDRAAVGARFEDFKSTEGRQQPAFLDGSKELTAAAAGSIAKVYQSLQDRSAAPSDEIQRFIMQVVWTLFAEDLRILDGMPFQRTVEQLRHDPSRNPAAVLGFLFQVLNQKGDHNRKGLLAGTHYVNGELFANPAAVDLNPAELDLRLTTLYNRMDDGAYADLKALHKTLDEAVAACYGWPKKVAPDDAALVGRLSDLNRAIVTGERPYHPVET